MDWSVFWVVLAQVVVALVLLAIPVSLFFALVVGSVAKVVQPPREERTEVRDVRDVFTGVRYE